MRDCFFNSRQKSEGQRITEEITEKRKRKEKKKQ